MLHERINLEDLKKFDSIKLRVKEKNISIELSIFEDELLIDVVPSELKFTKKHICEKNKFHHIMEECDKFNKKDIHDKCIEYDKKCHNPKKSYEEHIKDMIEDVESANEVDDATELSVKMVKDYLKKHKIPQEKLCSIFKEIWLDDPVKKWCEDEEEKRENSFEELLKATSNKNKSSMDFKEINDWMKNNPNTYKEKFQQKKEENLTSDIIQKLKDNLYGK